jgi:hypothetical protein
MEQRHVLGRANIINFIRFDHGMTTVEGEMQEILRRNLPATWLLQYDALAAGPYVDYLKANMTADHEVGLWFEVNKRHCDDAGVAFRGEIPDPSNTQDTENWDHHSQAMMSCGYTQKERVKLIDTMMRKFFQVFGKFPASVAAWYIDSYSLHYLGEKYHIAASANCKDQWGTDGYSLWGAPYHAFYYPSKTSAIMAASSPETQTHVPVFRMLGNDPVNMRNTELGANGQPVFTLEPAYPGMGGGSPEWVRNYFDLLLQKNTRPFAYFQVGQENSFNWENMKEAFCFQLDELIRRRDKGELIVETLEQTGRFAQQAFPETPVGILDANINLNGLETKAIWYHSKFYRAQILYSPNSFEIVDLYRYPANEMETYYQETVGTWTSYFMAQPVIDSFLFGSRWHLAGIADDGRPFDERQCPISDVALSLENELPTVTYRNGAGIHSRLTFGCDCIQVDRWCEGKATFNELISFNPQSRWSPVEGTYRNHIVFGWNNYDYRITIKENLPAYQPGQNRLLLRSAADTRESTMTVFVFPCATECSSRPCRQ